MRRLSLRGLLALAVGGVFLWFGWHPDQFGTDRPPVVVEVLVWVTGLCLIAMGLVSLRFVWRRDAAMRGGRPVPGEVTITVDDGSDSTTYDLDVRLNGQRWRIGAAGCRALREHRPGVAHPAEIWPDPRSGGPVAISLGGLRVDTLPAPRRVPD